MGMLHKPRPKYKWPPDQHKQRASNHTTRNSESSVLIDDLIKPLKLSSSRVSRVHSSSKIALAQARINMQVQTILFCLFSSSILLLSSLLFIVLVQPTQVNCLVSRAPPSSKLHHNNLQQQVDIIQTNLVRQHTTSPVIDQASTYPLQKFVKLDRSSSSSNSNVQPPLKHLLQRTPAASPLYSTNYSNGSNLASSQQQQQNIVSNTNWDTTTSTATTSSSSSNSGSSNARGVHIEQLVSYQCHELCAKDGEGCWGTGPHECMKCVKYRLETSEVIRETGTKSVCVHNCANIVLPGSSSILLAYDAGNDTCKKCHQECAYACSGTESRDCWQCKNVKDGPDCVSECPLNKFNNNGICEECDPRCVDGCTGPSNRLGEGGCNSCSKAIITHSNKLPSTSHLSSSGRLGGSSSHHMMIPSSFISDQPQFQAQCIRQDESCPEGFYQEYVAPKTEGLLKAIIGTPVCKKCHHRCKSCTSMGTHVSVCQCASYIAGEQCEDYCPRDYFTDEPSRRCIRCSSECNGCTGPTEADCINCRVYRVYYTLPASSNNSSTASDSFSSSSSSSQLSSLDIIDLSSSSTSSLSTISSPTSSLKQVIRFNCTAQCPPNKPHRISESNIEDPYCSENPGIEVNNSKFNSLLNSTYYLVIIIIFIAIMVCSFVYRFQLEKDKTYKLTMHLSGIEDVEPLTPSNLKPNLAPLRSIKESELRYGRLLGEGFGGKVYQGFWYPEQDSETHLKSSARPVAIKMLHNNGQSNKNREFLNEAYNMASVNHPNVVRLLAICMTPKHLLLVTQLMPLGCLLDYVKRYKKEIGAKNLLEWCKQIAKGMAYLEDKRMVHRDLALRNVLLQTCGRALISDFGLAKLLDFGQSEYQSGGGRLPIKWLAPECIRERKFTHKSDVWAFGVTVWELLTYGKRPFDEYNINDVHAKIEEGARLPQPKYMSAEVYKVMVACWFYNAEDRPDFKHLEENFVQFARDPERYLLCNSKGIDYSAPGKQQQVAELAANMILGGGGGGVTRKPTWSPACSEGQLSGSGAEDYTSADEPSSMVSGDDDMNSPSEGSPHGAGLSALPDLTPCTNNCVNEKIFDFSMSNNQHYNGQIVGSGHELFHEKERVLAADIAFKQQLYHQHHQAQHCLIAGSSRSHLVLTDANNNNLTDLHNHRLSLNRPQVADDHCHWTMEPTFSTTSLNRKMREQPTDTYDYLLPSPCTDEVDGGAGRFSKFYTPSTTTTLPLTPAQATLGPPPLPHQPSRYLSELAEVTNEEYFMSTRPSYVNQQVCLVPIDDTYTDELITTCNKLNRAQSFSKTMAGREEGLLDNNKNIKQMHHLSASNSNVPQSLV